MGGNTSKTDLEAKFDMDKRTMSNYYSQISELYSDKRKMDVYLTNVGELTRPPTINRIQKLVRKEVLTNAHYVLDNPESITFKLNRKQDEFMRQFDPDIKDFSSDRFQNFPVI